MWCRLQCLGYMLTVQTVSGDLKDKMLPNIEVFFFFLN